jgi:hypothetical protein
MTQVAMDDNGRMAAVFAPLEEVERILKTIDGYVVIANVNSSRQAVVGGASKQSSRPWKPSKKLAMTWRVACQPRLPHIDCGGSQQAAAPGSGAPASPIAAFAHRRQH